MEFNPGDHLRVWRRPLPYAHHGIYVSDDRVIQFGGRISDKRHATVGAVSLDEFSRGGRACVVQHGGRTWWSAPRFEYLARDKVVRRAERLATNHPDGLYDLFGYNCEQAATFCATGSYESYQVRGFFALRPLIGVPLGWYMSWRSGPGKGVSPRTRTFVWAWVITGLLSNLLYYRRGARFMREVGRPFQAYAQAHPDEDLAP